MSDQDERFELIRRYSTLPAPAREALASIQAELKEARDREAWLRTELFRTQPDFEAKWEAARADSTRLSLADIQACRLRGDTDE